MTSFGPSSRDSQSNDGAAKNLPRASSGRGMTISVNEKNIENDESTASFWKTAGYRDVTHSLRRIAECEEAVRHAKSKVSESISALTAARSLDDFPSTLQSIYKAMLQQLNTAYQDDFEIRRKEVVTNHETIGALGDAIRRMHKDDPHATEDARIYSPRASPDILPSITAETGGDQRGGAEDLSVNETLPSLGLCQSAITSTESEQTYLEDRKFTTNDDLLGAQANASFKRGDAFATSHTGILNAKHHTAPARSKVDGVVHVPENNDYALGTRLMAKDIPLLEAVYESTLLSLWSGAIDTETFWLHRSADSSRRFWKEFRKRKSTLTPGGRPDASRLPEATTRSSRDGVRGYDNVYVRALSPLSLSCIVSHCEMAVKTLDTQDCYRAGIRRKCIAA